MDEWRDHIARWNFEAEKFAKMASARRREAQDCRKKRDWLGALVADERAREYRAIRDDCKAEIKKTKQIYGLR